MDPTELNDILDLPGGSQPPQDGQPTQPIQPEQSPVSVSTPAQDTAAAQPKTCLNLNDERKAWLLSRALGRIDDCRASMGVEFGLGEALHDSWAWLREIAREGYDGVYEWRKGYGGVFTENNWSMNVPKRFVRLMAAKVNADLIGTEPYFAAMPEKVGADKAALSKAVEKKIQTEIADSNLSEVLREAVRVAICIGERAVKLANVVDKTTYKGPAVVALGKDGQPLKTTTGDYIYPKDDTVADPEVQGQFRLEKDPNFVINQDSDFMTGPDGGFNYQRVENLPQTLTHRDGLEAGGLACMDFLYPIEVPSLDKADIMVHVYDEAQENLERMYPWERIKMPEGDSGALSQASQPILEQGEQDRWLRPRERPLINLHETYIRCDADESGQEQWIFALIDYKNRELIYCEYLAAMNLKMPPFVLIRGVESVPGRAYGSGVYKMFMDKNLFIDVQFNRIALKSSKDGSITFVHKDGTEETKAGLTVVVGDKKQYTIPANTLYGKDRPPVFRVNLNEVDEFGFKLLETMIQTGMLEFGIVSAADGSESDLNASGTATGIRNIERTGNLLHRMTEDMIAKDLEKILDLAADIVIENMPDNATMLDPDTQALMTLNKEEIRMLNRDVRLLLTKVRSEEAIQTSTQVVALLDAYYARPMWLRKKVRPEYINLLKNLDVQDADERLQEPTPQQISQEAAQMAQAQKKALQASESMKIDPSMLLPTEISQALSNMGITPDPSRLTQGASAQPQTPQGTASPAIAPPQPGDTGALSPVSPNTVQGPPGAPQASDPTQQK